MSAQPLPSMPIRDALAREIEALDAGALWWLAGFAAGLARHRPVPAVRGEPAESPAAIPSQRFTIVYGTQTGNARRAAERLAEEAALAGHAVRLLRADAYPTRDLAAERWLSIVISTQGDGDPPDDAIALVEFLEGKRAPRLPQLRYAVLGLGDSSYPRFCAVSRRIDARLAELGAQRLAGAGEADLDIDTVATPWRARTLAALREQAAPANVTPLPGVTLTGLAAPRADAPAVARERPFAAELLLTQRLTARGSHKDVRHLEFSLAGSGLAWEPGDALGVWHRNPEPLVDAVLAAARLDGDAPVDGRPLRDVLAGEREITRLARPFLLEHARRAGVEARPEWLESHQLVDLLRHQRAGWTAADFAAALRPLGPRLYSIASAREETGDDVHLTVDVVRYQAFGETHAGAASNHLAGLAEGACARVFLEPNERFRLPVQGERDVIMVGAGTGVAPFRAFLQQRTVTGARGRHWLFFGAPRFHTDFLYQLEWQAARRAGTLQELDLAFSRDGTHKVYVQHRLRQRARDLHAWLDGGAHLYVCGSVAMGKDVHAALREVAMTERGVDRDGADEWLRGLQREGRYLKDVY